MLLTLSTTYRPATDLGFLLYKNPDAVRSVALGFGTARVFYPEATEERCTAALLLDVDPIALVRGRKGSASPSAALAQYVNDRPYVASSFMSVAIAKLFGTAMGGRSADRQEIAHGPREDWVRGQDCHVRLLRGVHVAQAGSRVGRSLVARNEDRYAREGLASFAEKRKPSWYPHLNK